MKFFRFLVSKTFWANIILIILFLAALFWGLNIFLDNYTRHDENLRVPDLSRLDYEEASEQLAKFNLDASILDTSEFDPDFPRGSVINQFPEPGHYVKEGREIQLTINPLKPRKVALPDLKEKTKRRAIYDLQSKGFIVGELSYVPYLGKDVVVETKVNGKTTKAGEKLEKGTVVNLVLGEGLEGGEKVKLPYLSSLSFPEARQKLLDASLNLGVVSTDTSVTDTLAALVYRQYPSTSGETKVSMGTEVDIWLTMDDTKIKNDSLLIYQREIADSLANAQ